MKPISEKCGGCDHPASFHPTIEQKRTYWAEVKGRYDLECHYFMGIGAPCCRCVASQEDVREER